MPGAALKPTTVKRKHPSCAVSWRVGYRQRARPFHEVFIGGILINQLLAINRTQDGNVCNGIGKETFRPYGRLPANWRKQPFVGALLRIGHTVAGRKEWQTMGRRDDESLAPTIHDKPTSSCPNRKDGVCCELFHIKLAKWSRFRADHSADGWQAAHRLWECGERLPWVSRTAGLSAMSETLSCLIDDRLSPKGQDSARDCRFHYQRACPASCAP